MYFRIQKHFFRNEKKKTQQGESICFHHHHMVETGSSSCLLTMASLSFSLSLSLFTVIISGKDSDWLVWIIHPPQWESGTGPAWLTLQAEHGSVTTRGWGSDARHLEARATKSVCTVALHSGSSWISHHHRKMQTWKTDLKWADLEPMIVTSHSKQEMCRYD